MSDWTPKVAPGGELTPDDNDGVNHVDDEDDDDDDDDDDNDVEAEESRYWQAEAQK